MTQKVINTGIQGNDGTGDSIRESFIKVNQNFTELYAVFGLGGALTLGSLSDGTVYTANQLIAGSTDGTKLSARTLTSNDRTVNIAFTSTGINLSTTAAKLVSDTSPTLNASMNVAHNYVGNFVDPSPAVVNSFNNLYTADNTSFGQLPVTVNYGINHYVAGVASNLSTVSVGSGVNSTKAGTYTVSAALKTRAQPSLPQTGDADYNSSLTSNYLATEVMQRKDVVYRGGDTMTGPLELSDHPTPLSGQGLINTSSDLQAATKYYVDNSTYYSNVNLYVSTSGDDSQVHVPAGRNGRGWQYAYKTVGAAALQAQNLISLSQLEAGPYRQTITYTINQSQTQSLVTSATATGGNSANTVYTNAQSLLESNRTFIQQETIAYINSKYVNTFSSTGYYSILKNIIDAVGYDLLLGSNFQSITQVSSLFNPTLANQNIIQNQLAQITDAIGYIQTQIGTYSYSSSLVQKYINQVVTALENDLAIGSNFQSTMVGLNFAHYGTGLNTAEITYALTKLQTRILAITVGSSNFATAYPDAANSITANIALIKNLVSGVSASTPTYPSNSNTTAEQVVIKQLLLNNISFIQAEIVGYLTANYSSLSYSQTTCQRDVQYIVWSLVYDVMYGGNSQSLYAGMQYWGYNYTNGTLQIQSTELTATINAVNYLKTLVNNIVINSPLGTTANTTLYQTTIPQYINKTLTGVTSGDTLVNSVIANIASIQTIISDSSEAIAQTYYNANLSNPSISFLGSGTELFLAYNAIISQNSSVPFSGLTISADLVSPNFTVINDTNVTSTLNTLFTTLNTLLTYGPNGTTITGSPSRPTPTLSSTPLGAITGYVAAATAINLNVAFIAEDAWHYFVSQYGAPSIGATQFQNAMKYIAEAIAYDITYTNSNVNSTAATVFAAQQALLYTSGSTEATYMYLTIKNRMSYVVSDIASGQSISGVLGLVPGYTYTNTQTSSTGSSNASTQIGALLTIAENIINSSGSTTPALPSVLSYTNVEFYPAFLIIESNDATIASSVVSYLNGKYTGGFNYNQSLCYRDVGYLVDALVIDAITSDSNAGITANFQSVNAGKAYYKNASAQTIAIGTQRVETLDGLNFSFQLMLQVLNQTQALRYQSAVTQTPYDSTKTSAVGAITNITGNYNTFYSIITNGYGSAPATPNYGDGLYQIQFSNGGRGYVDQGTPGDVHILPGKILIGGTSGAQGVIVSYTPGTTQSYDTIYVKMTQPGFFVANETLDFGETVANLNITIFVESGIYYEDFPIKIPANVTIRGDDFRRTIIRPLNRISQSNWRSAFFYRDVVVDNLLVGQINFPSLNRGGVDYASSDSITISATTGYITATLSTTNALTSWIGLILMVATSDPYGTAAKAVVTNVSGNILYCTVLQGYPFANSNVSPNVLAGGSWHLYNGLPYGRHYLTDPSNFYSTPLNNKQIDMFLVNDATRVKLITGQGHGGFMMVLDAEGQIKTKSPYAQESASFSGSINEPRFAGGQFIDGFSGRLYGNIISIGANASGTNGTSLTVQGSANTGLDVRKPQVPCSFFIQGIRYQVNDVASYSQSVTVATTTYVSGGASGASTIVVASANNIVAGQLVTGTGVPAWTYVSPNYTAGSTTIQLTTNLIAQAAGTYTFSVPQVTVTLDNSTPFYPLTAFGGSFSTLQTILNNLINALAYDNVFSTNYQSVKQALTLLQPQYSYTGLQLALLLQSISYTGSLIAGLTSPSVSSNGQTSVANNISTILNILNNGVAAVPTITWTSPVTTSYNTAYQVNAKNILQANKAFVQQEITAWINANYNVSTNTYYSAAKSQRDIGYIIDALTYDIMYNNSSGNSNSMTYDTAMSFYSSGTSLLTGTQSICVASYARLSTVLQAILLNTPVTPTAGNNVAQITNLTAASSTEVSRISTLVSQLSSYVSSGSWGSVTRNVPTYTSQTSGLVTDFTTITGNASTALVTPTVTYISNGGNLLINFETAGNRSMLANDFTQVNDLGYGVLATNNGLTEQVSTFTYYCHTAYWALNGAQIRSVAGSNAQGDYGLRASGYDLTQLPNIVTLANDQVQTARIYKQGITLSYMTPTSSVPALSIWVTGYKYTPYNNSEVEIDHTLQGGGVTRYLVSSIQHTGIEVLVNGTSQDVLQLTFSTTGQSSATGLQYAVYDGQQVTIRVLQNQKVLNVATVHPTRPSTSLQYSSNLASIYRIITYNLSESTGETLVGLGTPFIAVVSAGSTSSSVIQVTNPTGTIAIGQLVTGSGLNGTYTVYAVTLVSGTTYAVTLTSPPGSNPIGQTYTFQAQTLTTSIIQTDSSFNYFQLSSDPANVINADPTAYSSGYAKGTCVSYTVSAGPTYTLVVAMSTAPVVGQVVGGLGLNGNIVATVSGPSGGNYTVTLSKAANTTTPPVAGVPIWFTNYTQGATIGDNKIAITSIANSATISQINNGSYVTTWGGRVHRITGYVGPLSTATATYVSGGTSTSGSPTTLVVSSVGGTIIAGMVVYSSGGYTAGQTVVGTPVYNSLTGQTTITLSATANIAGTQTGTIYFSQVVSSVTGLPVASNAYLIIDPNSTLNLASNGLTPAALTFAGAQTSVNGTSYEFVTYNVPNTQTNAAPTPVLPPVDSWLTISGSSSAPFNNTNAYNINLPVQVVGAISVTTIQVPSTAGLAVGMIVSSTTPNAIIPPNCIVQSVSLDTYTFTVSPAVWIPSGGNITAQFPTTVASIQVINAGAGEYATAPTITIASPGNGGVQATATATVTNGYVNGPLLTLINGGTGYTGVPTVTASYGTATFLAVLSSNTVFSQTITAETGNAISTVNQVTVAYPATLSNTITGTATAVAASGNVITLSSSSGLSVGNQIIFTTPVNGSALGNLVSGTPYYILSVGVGSITISGTQNGTVFSPLSTGTATGTMNFSATAFTFGTPFAISAASASGSGTSTYAVTFTVASMNVVNGSYYRVYGSSNPLFNGTWPCTSTTNTGVNTIVLTYPSNPGSFTGTAYVALETTTSSSSTLGIGRPFSLTANNSLRVGCSAGTTGQIIVNISTCRVTGHDFLGIGTGGYNTTNYPNTIYGPPSLSANPANQVLEETVGRVFYVSTDENGIFRVGRFFTVDQGTGTVTFSASIALSNLSGLGFKQGVVVTQFSTDATMNDNSTSIVPVQSAIRSYVDYRLGVTQSGAPVSAANLIKPGFLPLNGILPMSANLNLGNNTINNVGLPINATDATNKQYVDAINYLAQQKDVNINNPVPGNILVYDTTTGYVSATATGVNTITLVASANSTVSTLEVGDTIIFAGTSQGGVTNGTYYITGISGNNITVSAALDGSTFAVTANYTGGSGGFTWTSSRWRNILVPQGTGSSAVTGGSTTAGTATITYTSGSTLFPIGSTVVITGCVPITYNGIFTVTAASAGSVSFANSYSSGSLTAYGTIIGNSVSISYNGGAGGSLTSEINSNSIVDSMVISTANIQQSKLLLNVPGATYTTTVESTAASASPTVISNGTTLSSYPTGTPQQIQAANGLASFNSAVFTQTNGWVNLQNASNANGDGTGNYKTGIPQTALQFMSAGTVLGNLTGVAGNANPTYPQPISFANIVTNGNAVTNQWFTSTGIMTVSSVSTGTFNGSTVSGLGNHYTTTNITQSGGSNPHAASSIVQTGTDGTIDVAGLNLNSYPTVSLSGTTGVFFTTPGSYNWQYMSVSGSSNPSGTIQLGSGGYIDTSSSSGLFVNSIVAGGANPSSNPVAPGGTGNAGSVYGKATFEGQFSLVGGSTMIATYSADLAEYYEGDAEYDVGTVVIFGGDKEITTTTTINDTALAGVVSSTEKAAYVMYSDCPGLKNLVALAGRVPCKVVGRVKKGDMLTTSATAGYAVKALNPTLGAIIGKALEDKDYGEAGIIEVAVGRN